MKFKKIMLVTFVLLAILTIGSVSAADDVDALAVDDTGDVIDAPVDESEIIALDSEDEPVGDGLDEKYNVTIEVSRADEAYYGMEAFFEVSVNPADDECEYSPEGDIILYLNGEEYTRGDTYYPHMDVSFDDFGDYNFRVEYVGDDNFKPAECEFNYTLTNSMYIIETHEDIAYDSTRFEVLAPVMNPADIVVTINGKKYNVFVYDDVYYCNASGLKYGWNTINFYYPGDENFGELSLDKDVNVVAYMNWNDDVDLVWGNPVEISLKVPEDATGTLKVYSYEYGDEGTVYSEIASVDVKNGAATALIEDLNVGINRLYANFTGSVEVRDLDLQVGVRPLITVPKSIIVGEDAYIDVKTSEGATGRLDVFYYLNEEDSDTIKLGSYNVVDNQVKVPLSSLKEGYYALDLYYYYTDYEVFDDYYLLYVLDNYDVDFNISEFNRNILVDSGVMPIWLDIPEYLDGEFTLYIDGKAVDNASTADFDYLLFNASGLSIGEHALTVNFTSAAQGMSSKTVKFDIVPADILIPDKLNLNDRFQMSANNIVVEVYNDALGTITILVDNEEYVSEGVNAKAFDETYYRFTLEKVPRGSHYVAVTYNDDKYGPVSVNKTVDFGYEIPIYGEWLYGQDNLITVYLPNDLGNGELTITLDGNKVSGTKNASNILINPSILPIGNHTVVVKYAGDDFYTPKEVNNTIEVMADIQCDSSIVLIGSEEGITLVLPSDAKGKLNVTVERDGFDDDGNYYVNEYDSQLISLVDGKAYYSFSKLPLGSYAVRASYTGNDYYVYPPSFYIDVTSIKWGDSYIDIGENQTLTFISANTEPGKLHVILSRIIDEDKDWNDPVNVVETLDLSIVDGKVAHTFTNLKIGRHIISVSEQFTDGTPKGFQDEYIFDVDGPYADMESSEFALDNMSKIVMDFPSDADGKVTVTFYTNFTKEVPDIYKTVDYPVNGKLTIDLNDIIEDAGIYKFLFNYTGNYGDFKSMYYEFRVTPAIAQKIDPVIVAKDTSVLYTANGKFYATVYGDDGKLAEGVEVIFKINNKQVGKGITNENGVAYYIVKSMPKTYNVVATALGASVTKKLTVNHVLTLKKVTVKKSAKKLVLTATLKKVNGKYLKNKKITFKFKGKKYTAKTNKKGVAKVTIKKAVLKKLKVGKKVAYQATYLKDTVKKTAKVKK